MPDSFNPGPRRNPRSRSAPPRKSRHKASHGPAIGIGVGVAVVLVVVFGFVWLGRRPSTDASGRPIPTTAELIAAGPELEAKNQAARLQNPVRHAWYPLNHESRRFNVLLPVPFRNLDARSQSSGYGTMSAETYGGSNGEYDFQVSLFRVATTNTKSVTDVLKELGGQEATPLLQGAQVITNRELTWNGLACRELELRGGAKHERVRYVVLDSETAVILSCLGTVPVPQPEVDRFFNSFSLEGDPQKYGSPKGWPESTELIAKMCIIDFAKGMERPFPRDMDRTRWLQMQNTPVNVLAQVDVLRDANLGNWYPFREGVVSPAKTGMLILPVEPANQYEIDLDVRRVSYRPESFNIGLVVDGQPAMIVVDGFGGKKTCLSPVDGKYGHEIPNVPVGTLLDYRNKNIKVRVTPKSIRMTIDGLSVVEFDGDASRLGLDRRYWFPPLNALFIASWETQYYVSRYEVRRL